MREIIYYKMTLKGLFEFELWNMRSIHNGHLMKSFMLFIVHCRLFIDPPSLVVKIDYIATGNELLYII